MRRRGTVRVVEVEDFLSAKLKRTVARLFKQKASLYQCVCREVCRETGAGFFGYSKAFGKVKVTVEVHSRSEAEQMAERIEKAFWEILEKCRGK